MFLWSVVVVSISMATVAIAQCPTASSGLSCTTTSTKVVLISWVGNDTHLWAMSPHDPSVRPSIIDSNLYPVLVKGQSFLNDSWVPLLYKGNPNPPNLYFAQCSISGPFTLNKFHDFVGPNIAHMPGGCTGYGIELRRNLGIQIQSRSLSFYNVTVPPPYRLLRFQNAPLAQVATFDPIRQRLVVLECPDPSTGQPCTRWNGPNIGYTGCAWRTFQGYISSADMPTYPWSSFVAVGEGSMVVGTDCGAVLRFSQNALGRWNHDGLLINDLDKYGPISGVVIFDGKIYFSGLKTHGIMSMPLACQAPCVPTVAVAC